MAEPFIQPIDDRGEFKLPYNEECPKRDSCLVSLGLPCIHRRKYVDDEENVYSGCCIGGPFEP